MRGDAALARSSALLAGRLAPTAELRARALYLRALASMALGNAQGAREDLRASVQVYAGGDGGHRAAVMLALWEGQVPDVRSADDRAKVLLYHAAGALERGDQTGALDALQRGMATGSAYVAALCSILLPRLRDWSARSSSPLPAWTPPSRVIEVKVRGVLGVAVNGQRVHSRVPAGAAALLAALADADVGGTGERHALPAARVILEALGGRASELPRALHHARMLIGDADAVQETRMGEVPWLRLSESWSWMVDASGHGRILGGLDVPVAQTYT
ncbi:hypothetical protein [Deinococcus yunweiensis]|uniref:hypothetical protein n=1 Tax=Deinococcus yunweiensis TaxID=367282 RepID=UPI00398F5AB1